MIGRCGEICVLCYDGFTHEVDQTCCFMYEHLDEQLVRSSPTSKMIEVTQGDCIQQYASKDSHCVYTGPTEQVAVNIPTAISSNMA